MGTTSEFDTVIILPVYNTGKYLVRCIGSILAQSYGGWKCVVIDDGSTDDSAAQLDEIAAKDGRFEIHHVKNAGAPADRNLAFDIVSGERVKYVYLADSDDVLHPELLASARNALECSPSADFVRIDAISFSDSRDFEWPKAEIGGYQVLPARDDFVSTRGLCAPWRFFFRHESVRGHRYLTSFGIGEDLPFMAGYVSVPGRQVVALSRVLYAYRQRVGSLVHCDVSKLKVRAKEFHALMTEVFRACRGDRGILEAVCLPIVKQWIRMADAHGEIVAVPLRHSLHKLLSDGVLKWTYFSFRWRLRLWMKLRGR